MYISIYFVITIITVFIIILVAKWDSIAAVFFVPMIALIGIIVALSIKVITG